MLTYLPACLPACLLACLPACLPACLLACLLACLRPSKQLPLTQFLEVLDFECYEDKASAELERVMGILARLSTYWNSASMGTHRGRPETAEDFFGATPRRCQLFESEKPGGGTKALSDSSERRALRFVWNACSSVLTPAEEQRVTQLEADRRLLQSCRRRGWHTAPWSETLRGFVPLPSARHRGSGRYSVLQQMKQESGKQLRRDDVSLFDFVGQADRSVAEEHQQRLLICKEICCALTEKSRSKLLRLWRLTCAFVSPMSLSG